MEPSGPLQAFNGTALPLRQHSNERAETCHAERSLKEADVNIDGT